MEKIPYQAIQQTNDDAAMCKASCVNLGYFQDPHIRYFVKDNIRRPPLINRGYWTRVTTINKIIQLITDNGIKFQIVNLGAGFDTLFWKLKVFICFS